MPDFLRLVSGEGSADTRHFGQYSTSGQYDAGAKSRSQLRGVAKGVIRPMTQVPRRRFLGFLTEALLAVIGLCLAIPALAYIWAPLRRKSPEDATGSSFVEVGSLADLPVGQWRQLTVDALRQDGWEKTQIRRAVWVRRQGNTVAVLSPICPHLGCPVNWHPEQSEFRCPCHGGIFNADGQLVAGPPPRGMDELAHETREGQLWVQWQDFKIGVRDRVPVDI
jgi:menaquinol-cytochrome c reductase iron-sulfur subunit